MCVVVSAEADVRFVGFVVFFFDDGDCVAAGVAFVCAFDRFVLGVYAAYLEEVDALPEVLVGCEVFEGVYFVKVNAGVAVV